MKNQEILPETSLDSLGFPNLEIILTEGFKVLPKNFGTNPPQSIVDLAGRVEMETAQVIEKVQKLLQLSKDLFISLEELKIQSSSWKDGFTFIDFDKEIITHGDKHFSMDGFDMQEYFSKKSPNHRFVVYSKTQSKKISAVYFLRQKGFSRSIAIEPDERP